MYWWTPTAAVAKYDLVNVALPEYTEDCYADPAAIDCDYPEDVLIKVRLGQARREGAGRAGLPREVHRSPPRTSSDAAGGRDRRRGRRRCRRPVDRRQRGRLVGLAGWTSNPRFLTIDRKTALRGRLPCQATTTRVSSSDKRRFDPQLAGAQEMRLKRRDGRTARHSLRRFPRLRGRLHNRRRRWPIEMRQGKHLHRSARRPPLPGGRWGDGHHALLARPRGRRLPGVAQRRSRPTSSRRSIAGFIEAGSDIVLTNTFGGNRLRLDLHNLGDRVAELNAGRRRGGETGRRPGRSPGGGRRERRAHRRAVRTAGHPVTRARRRGIQPSNARRWPTPAPM